MRKPLYHPIVGGRQRQYGETVRKASVRLCSGENLRLVEYEAKENEDLFSAFARDIEKGHYENRIIYSAFTYMRDDETTVLLVTFSDLFGDGYKWGQEPLK